MAKFIVASCIYDGGSGSADTVSHKGVNIFKSRKEAAAAIKADFKLNGEGKLKFDKYGSGDNMGKIYGAHSSTNFENDDYSLIYSITKMVKSPPVISPT